MANSWQKLALESATVTTCVLLTLVSFCWGADKPPKKYATSPSHPHPVLEKTEAPHSHHMFAKGEGEGYTRSSAPAPSRSKSQTASGKELTRLEHQNIKSQSVQRNRASGTAAHIHPESANHSSGITFSYHPPRGQSTGISGGHKH